MSPATVDHRRLEGYGWVALNAGLVLQLSWIPMLGFLEGSEWPSLGVAVGSHYFALSFLIAAPIAFGLRLFLAATPGERGKAMREWVWRCLFPLASYALAIKLAMRLVPHINVPVIIGLMGATVPLAIYGTLLRREAAAIRRDFNE